MLVMMKVMCGGDYYGGVGDGGEVLLSYVLHKS